MYPRKRQAQPLLPTRNPKQPRLALTGYDGGAPSPSETEGIRARWLSLAKELTVLVTDTLENMLPTTSLKSIPQPPLVNESSNSHNSTPSSSTSTAKQYSVAYTPKRYDSFPSNTPRSSTPRKAAIHHPSIRPEHIPLPPSPHKPSFYRPSSPPPNLDPLNFTLYTRAPNQSTLKRDSVASDSVTPIPVLERGATSPDHMLKSSVMPKMETLQLENTAESSTMSQASNSSSSLFSSSDDSTDSKASSSLQSSSNFSTSQQSSDSKVSLQSSSILSTSDDSKAPESSSLLSSSPFFDSSQMNPNVTTSRWASYSLQREALRRNLVSREHIYSKVHKASIRRNHLQLREEITRELFTIKRQIGYTSGFTDFKGLLDYQRRLQNIDLESAPPLLRPILNLGAKLAPRSRRPREVDDEDTQFLKRALDNAKATLNSPKPPKPFAPTLEQLRLLQRARDDAIEQRIRPPVPALPSNLPPPDEQFVKEVLQKRGMVAKFSKEQVNSQDIVRLLPGQWLNDEIINFYGAMLLGRSESSKENPGGKKSKKILLNIHYFSSFFWTKLTQEGYERARLAKWTKKIDIFSKDTILMPVNHGNAHWTAAAINFRAKRFESYDSMGMAKGHVFKQLRSYVNSEHQNKKKKDFDFTGWENWAPDSTPQQENGFDCGVFTCQFLEALSRGEEFFNFSQKDMPYLRRRMVWEIGKAKLRDDR